MSLELLYDEKEMYLFLKNYCEKKKYVNALRALDYAIVHHEGQFRKGNGLPYITHPMAVAYFLILSGIENDNAIAVSFLHDVPEDCGTDLSDLNVNEDIKHSANILNWKQYKVKYADYQNKYYEDYFYINSDGSGEYITNYNSQPNETLTKYYIHINSNEDDSNKIANIIIEYLKFHYEKNN